MKDTMNLFANFSKNYDFVDFFIGLWNFLRKENYFLAARMIFSQPED